MVMKEAFRKALEDHRNRGIRSWLGFSAAKVALFIGGVKDTSPVIETPQPLQAESIKVYPEISLEEEWLRQAKNLASIFAKELNQTEEQYIEILPKFEPQPAEYKGRLDIPVLVETRISLAKMVKKAKIDPYFNANLIKDWEEGKFQTPNTPYTAWIDDGTPNLNKSVYEVRKCLGADERGGNIYDGIALYLKDPKILENHYLDFPGSQVGSDRAPVLGRWVGGPGLGYYFVGRGGPRSGSVVAGKL